MRFRTLRVLGCTVLSAASVTKVYESCRSHLMKCQMYSDVTTAAWEIHWSYKPKFYAHSVWTLLCRAHKCNYGCRYYALTNEITSSAPWLELLLALFPGRSLQYLFTEGEGPGKLWNSWAITSHTMKSGRLMKSKVKARQHPTLCLLNVPHVTKSPRPSSSMFAYCKWSNTGGGNGLVMRLSFTLDLTSSVRLAYKWWVYCFVGRSSTDRSLDGQLWYLGGVATAWEMWSMQLSWVTTPLSPLCRPAVHFVWWCCKVAVAHRPFCTQEYVQVDGQHSPRHSVGWTAQCVAHPSGTKHCGEHVQCCRECFEASWPNSMQEEKGVSAHYLATVIVLCDA